MYQMGIEQMGRLFDVDNGLGARYWVVGVVLSGQVGS